MSEKPPTAAELPGLWEAKAAKVSTSNFTSPLTQYGNGVKDCASDLRAALTREAEREPTEAEVERFASITYELKPYLNKNTPIPWSELTPFWHNKLRNCAHATIIALRKGGVR